MITNKTPNLRYFLGRFHCLNRQTHPPFESKNSPKCLQLRQFFFAGAVNRSPMSLHFFRGEMSLQVPIDFPPINRGPMSIYNDRFRAHLPPVPPWFGSYPPQCRGPGAHGQIRDQRPRRPNQFCLTLGGSIQGCSRAAPGWGPVNHSNSWGVLKIYDWLVVFPQPIWKICASQNGFIFPNFRGDNKKYLKRPSWRPIESW